MILLKLYQTNQKISLGIAFDSTEWENKKNHIEILIKLQYSTLSEKMLVSNQFINTLWSGRWLDAFKINILVCNKLNVFDITPDDKYQIYLIRWCGKI